MATDPKSPADGGLPLPGPSRIVLTFSAPNAADCSIGVESVTPGQLYLAAWSLERYAEAVHAGLQAQTSLAQAVPGDLARIFDDIRAGRGRQGGKAS